MDEIEKAVIEYLKKVGSVDRKDIVEHDFREGIKWGLRQRDNVIKSLEKTVGVLERWGVEAEDSRIRIRAAMSLILRLERDTDLLENEFANSAFQEMRIILTNATQDELERNYLKTEKHGH